MDTTSALTQPAAVREEDARRALSNLPDALARWAKHNGFRELTAAERKSAPECAILTYNDDEGWRWADAYVCGIDEDGWQFWLECTGRGFYGGRVSDFLTTPRQFDAEMDRAGEIIDEQVAEDEDFVIADAWGL